MNQTKDSLLTKPCPCGCSECGGDEKDSFALHQEFPCSLCQGSGVIPRTPAEVLALGQAVEQQMKEAYGF